MTFKPLERPSKGRPVCKVLNQFSTKSPGNRLRPSQPQVSKPLLIAAWNRFWTWGVATPITEQIRIAAVVLGRRERDRIDALLDDDLAGGRKPGDPIRERSDEIGERPGGQRSIETALAFGQFRIAIVGAQHDLECSGARHEASGMLDSSSPRDHTEARLRQPKIADSRVASACRTPGQIRCRPADATFDRRDRDEAACAQMVKQRPSDASPVNFAASCRYSST